MLFSVKFWVFMKKKWKVIQTEMKERPLPYEALTILCLKSWFKDRIAFLLTFIALTWIWLTGWFEIKVIKFKGQHTRLL